MQESLSVSGILLGRTMGRSRGLSDEFARESDALADLEVRAEVFWAGLHGLVTLMRGGRLPRETHDRRVALLLATIA